MAWQGRSRPPSLTESRVGSFARLLVWPKPAASNARITGSGSTGINWIRYGLVTGSDRALLREVTRRFHGGDSGTATGLCAPATSGHTRTAAHTVGGAGSRGDGEGAPYPQGQGGNRCRSLCRLAFHAAG